MQSMRFPPNDKLVVVDNRKIVSMGVDILFLWTLSFLSNPKVVSISVDNAWILD